MKDFKFTNKLKKEEITELFKDNESVRNRTYREPEEVCVMLQALLMMRRYDELIALADRYFEQAPVSDEEAYCELYYYKLLASCEAQDEYDLIHAEVFHQVSQTKEFADAQAHPCEKMAFVLEGVEHFKEAKDPEIANGMLRAFRKEKNPEFLAAFYRILGKREEAREIYRKLYQTAFDAEDYSTAWNYYLKIAETKEEQAYLKKLAGYSDAKKAFDKEVGDPGERAKKLCKQQAEKPYQEYMKAVNNYENSGFSYGKKYFIAALVALLCSVGILFDRHVQNGILYIGWGVAMSVLIHIRFFMDFGLIKSGAMTAALCATPMFLYMLLDEQLWGAIVVFAVSLVLFLLALRQEKSRRTAQKEQARAEAIKAEHLDPILNAELDRLREKYIPMTDAETVRRWLVGFELPICF